MGAFGRVQINNAKGNQRISGGRGRQRGTDEKRERVTDGDWRDRRYEEREENRGRVETEEAFYITILLTTL